MLFLANLYHPETLRFDSFDGVTHLLKVDHPVTRPLSEGAPDLGWEGDPALCMYLDAKLQVWVLVRLENDGQYRTVTVSPTGTQLNPEEINRLIRRLIAHDTHRGFKLKESVDANNAAIDAEKARVAGERHEDVAEKLRWGLKKDLG